MKKGVSPTCGQSFVSLASLSVPLLAITSLWLLENSLFLKFTSGLNQAKCGLAYFNISAKSYTKSIVYMDNWANSHIILLFKEMLNFKVSPKKVINNLGKNAQKQ